MLPPKFSFKINFPSEDGFLGYACATPECKQYFKVLATDAEERMHCPYCGVEDKRENLFTGDQAKYMREAVVAEATHFAASEIQKMLKGALGNSKHVKLSLTPLAKKKVTPTYLERKVDAELTCAKCSCRFQIHGLFGYCPRCAESNLLIYETNWAIIEKEINGATDQKKALRYAYGDFVSAFEIFCKGKARQCNAPTVNFQSLFDTRKSFKEALGLDMLAGLKTEELLSLRRVFQKRHLCTHVGQTITDRYVREIPEDRNLVGKAVELSLTELQTAANALRSALAELVKATSKKG